MILVKLRSVLAQQLSDYIITSEDVTLKLGYQKLFHCSDLNFMDEIMTRCNLEKKSCPKIYPWRIAEDSHNFVTSVVYSKMGIHVVLAFVCVSLKHVLLAIQVDNK